MEGISPYYNRFEAFSSKQVFKKPPFNLYEPVQYIMKNGGKRLRPVMTLLGHHLFDPGYDRSLPLAYAVELFHNFSLVHDDIMDEAPLRRNLPTVHHKFGINNGILSGDLMLVLVYQYLNKISDESKLPKVLKVFNEAAIKVCEGQQMDMDFESRKQVSISEYLTMISYKTAALLAASLGIGALMGGADLEDFENIFEFGRKAGIAFQLQDDILDTFGDPEKFGKKVGGDIAQNKKTFLILKALEIGNTSEISQLQNLMSSKDIFETDKINGVIAILNRLKVQELAEAEKRKYHSEALEHLNQVKGAEGPKSILLGLSNALLIREV